MSIIFLFYSFLEYSHKKGHKGDHHKSSGHKGHKGHKEEHGYKGNKKGEHNKKGHKVRRFYQTHILYICMIYRAFTYNEII